MQFHFYKYQGTGNDFIIADNRKNEYSSLTTGQIHHLCDRRFGIGADGLMLLNEKEGYDFEMKYYNADGKEGTMCGNGGRCITKFAYHLGIHREVYHFLAADGPHEAEIDMNGIVSLKMKNVDVSSCEIIYSVKEGVITKANEKHLIDISQRLMKIDGIQRVNLIEQMDDILR